MGVHDGVSDTCYHPFGPGLEVGIAATFPTEEDVRSRNGLWVVRNPQLIRNQGHRGVRAYHPAMVTVHKPVRIISFVRWFDWQLAEKLQLVLRWQKRAYPALCARFHDEKKTFGFEPQRDRRKEQASRHRYTNLDFFCHKKDFGAVYVRSGNGREHVEYFRVAGAILSEGDPVVTVTSVDEGLVPEALVVA